MSRLFLYSICLSTCILLYIFYQKKKNEKKKRSIRIKYCESVENFPKIAFYGFYVYWTICSWHTTLSLVDLSVFWFFFCFTALIHIFMLHVCWAYSFRRRFLVCMCFFFCEWIWLRIAFLAKFLALYVMQSHLQCVFVYAFRAYKSFWRICFPLLSNWRWVKWKSAFLIRFSSTQTEGIRHRNRVFG